MTAYLIKSILCSAIIWSVYKIALEPVRIHRFKRFFLLGGLIASFIIPALTFTVHSTPAYISEIFITHEDISVLPAEPEPVQTAVNGGISASHILGCIYIAIAVVIFFCFVRSMISVFSETKRSKGTAYMNCRLIEIDSKHAPYTILRNIFIPKDERLNNEILTHEVAHARQLHSIDIIFIELLQVMFWFNPMLILYKKAIRLNHEFLADEYVVSNHINIARYQALLIGYSTHTGNYGIASHFNYLTIKKRLTMMTKKKSRTGMIFSISSVLSMSIILVFVFSNKVTAKDSNVSTAVTTEVSEEAQSKGAAKEMMDEYEHIANKAIEKGESEKGHRYRRVNRGALSESDVARMKEIFLSMSAEQRDQLEDFTFARRQQRPISDPPSQEEFESWKNPDKYGVWLNWVRIDNSELDKYTNKDIGYSISSRLAKNATNYGKHEFQLDILTVDFIKAQNEEAAADTDIYLYIKSPKELEKHRKQADK